MRKQTILLILIFLIPIVSANIIVNEVELNPPGSDKGNEWIELYSKKEIDLTNWSIVNNDNQSITLNQTFQGYLIISLEKQWLDNSDERVFLIDNNQTLIYETPILKDSKNNNQTYSNCDDEWIFVDSTEGLENNCESLEEETFEEEIQEEPGIQTESVPQPIKENKNPKVSKEPIRLTNSKTYNKQTEDIKTQNNIFYQSKNELIKKYSVYGFAILCAILCVLLAFNKLN